MESTTPFVRDDYHIYTAVHTRAIYLDIILDVCAHDLLLFFYECRVINRLFFWEDNLFFFPVGILKLTLLFLFFFFFARLLSHLAFLKKKIIINAFTGIRIEHY